MAQNDVTLFEELSIDTGDGTHDFDTHVFKAALISDAAPSLATANPTLASFTEAAPATGNYTAGGITLTNVTYTEAGGTATLDFDDFTISKHASNPTNARWILIINSTAANVAVGLIDLGSTFDLTTGDLVVVVNASGILTVSVP